MCRAEQKNMNQVVRELKWLDVKEPDPYLLNVRELRGRNVSEELHTPSIQQPPQAQCVCIVQFKISKQKVFVSRHQ